MYAYLSRGEFPRYTQLFGSIRLFKSQGGALYVSYLGLYGFCSVNFVHEVLIDFMIPGKYKFGVLPEGGD